MSDEVEEMDYELQELERAEQAANPKLTISGKCSVVFKSNLLECGTTFNLLY